MGRLVLLGRRRLIANRSAPPIGSHGHGGGGGGGGGGSRRHRGRSLGRGRTSVDVHRDGRTGIPGLSLGHLAQRSPRLALGAILLLSPPSLLALEGALAIQGPWLALDAGVHVGNLPRRVVVAVDMLPRLAPLAEDGRAVVVVEATDAPYRVRLLLGEEVLPRRHVRSKPSGNMTHDMWRAMSSKRSRREPVQERDAGGRPRRRRSRRAVIRGRVVVDDAEKASLSPVRKAEGLSQPLILVAECISWSRQKGRPRGE